MKQKKWDINNISDQKGRTVIVTGSRCGIGFETARVLAHKNADVIIAVLNPKKGKKAVAKIRGEKPDVSLKVMDLDLADINSINEIIWNFKKEHRKLDLLINNAGVMVPPLFKNKGWI